MNVKYFLLDVFTDKALSGNPLAVVIKADFLSDEMMQRLATEFNLSKTVFVRQPRLDYHAASLRIFTPKSELSFAGHPTVGAAVLLGLEQRLAAVRLEEEIGLLTCVIERTSRRSAIAHFSLPQLPERLGDLPDTGIVAEALGLAPSDLGSDIYTGGIYSAGLPYYLVPVRTTEALSRIHIERRGWANVFSFEHHSVYAFVPTPDEKSNDFAARMFTTILGSGEDPATGSAAAALIGLIADFQPADGSYDLTLRQGCEINRPSLISLRFTKANGVLERAGIGGSAVLLAEGEIDLTE